MGAALSLLASGASADQFRLIYNGSFSTANALNPVGGPTQFFSTTTPFTLNALFDTDSENLVAPVGVSGFVAYSPLSALLTVGGQTYRLTTYDQDAVHGVSVTIFDDTTPFSPGRYGVGIIQNPLADGAGFVGDFLGATPAFSAANLKPTQFTGYQGVGYGSGPPSGGFGSPLTVVPIPLTASGGQSYLLTLGAYDEEFSQGSPLNTARLQAVSVPEPSSAGLCTAGLMLLPLVFRRRRHA